jgi:hypothetical protein
MKQNINNKKEQKIDDSVTKVMKIKYENRNTKQSSLKQVPMLPVVVTSKGCQVFVSRACDFEP